jgi:hypothetical protein
LSWWWLIIKVGFCPQFLVVCNIQDDGHELPVVDI